MTLNDPEIEKAKSQDDDISFSEDAIIGDVDDDDDVDELPEGDSWIEELECALLADCDQTLLKKISEGKRIPNSLRPDFWRALLALNEAGPVKLCTEFDLSNQLEVRGDCEKLVADLSRLAASTSDAKPIVDVDALHLISSFESTITTYVKARPELSYIPDNGWIDILKVLHHLNLSDAQLYQMFFRIVDRYIPKDLSHRSLTQSRSSNAITDERQTDEATTDSKSQPDMTNGSKKKESEFGDAKANVIKPLDENRNKNLEDKSKEVHKSVQAYHLLRLLIQYHDPALCSMLESKKVTPNLYVKDWFCSLFARSCSPQMGLLIWDAHFKMADPFLIFFAAIVMVVNASDELRQSNMDEETMLNILKTMPGRLEEADIEDLYYLVANHYTNTTPRSIRSYSHLFFLDTFGNTYLGNESPIDGTPLKYDLKTSQLTSQLDLSQYLCLPIVPAEIFAIDTARSRSTSPESPSLSHHQLRYFLVDCRPAEQYNAGHLKKAFHLDCSLMLTEPSSFATAVNVLLDIQKQVVASKSNTGGQHLCFIGSGHEEEDQYVNMVVASFLQKYQSKYVSIVVGGFNAIHDYVDAKSELKNDFNEFIIDHNPELCKVCYTRSPDAFARYKSIKAQQQASASIASSAQQLFSSTASFLRGDKAALTKFAANHPQTSQLAQSGASMFDKFAKSFVSKSNVIKDRLVETLQTTSLPVGTVGATSSGRSHVSSQDKLGRRYTGSARQHQQVDMAFHEQPTIEQGPVQEVQLESWQKEAEIFAIYKCSEIKGQTRYPGYIALSKTDMWILREIPHNKGFASIAAKRPLDTIVQITSKRRQPEMIVFRYGHMNRKKSTAGSEIGTPEGTKNEGRASTSDDKSSAPKPTTFASDHLNIPQPFDLIRLIKREIIRIMDQPKADQKPATNSEVSETENDATSKPDDKAHSETAASEKAKQAQETKDDE